MFLSEIATRGLGRRRERAALAGCLVLVVLYAAVLVGFQVTADPVDRRFYQRRDAFNLALLQRHRMVVGEPVLLSQAGNPPEAVALLRGWSTPEPLGIWTDGPEAVLAVALPQDAPPGLTLVVDAGVALAGDGAQEVAMTLNGHAGGHWDVHAPSVVLQVPIAPTVADADGTVRIGFSIARPQHPGHDPRLLGVSVQRLTLRAGPV